MRICIVTATNKLVESQSDASEGTMIRNALQYGYNEPDLEEKDVTEEEYETLLSIQPIPADQQIAALKAKLTNTDYVVIKITEGAATVEEHADTITQRQAWREEINQLKNSVD